ncbi:unnamed protein product [Cuscuta europaea]|uniref:Uncharacterized protein n=1 Tax=Cuscuta europaea TaxID=41803 RepID=A0A9P0ZC81_CUSEU|nr:unnamed protein product [Cuscuta europaea]CAH9093689.1 unnamed protein product [Cuscuta europaea]
MASCNQIIFFTSLIVFGILFMRNNVEKVEAADIFCTQECNPEALYMLCPQNNTKIYNICKNCCQAGLLSCHLYRDDDSLIC